MKLNKKIILAAAVLLCGLFIAERNFVMADELYKKGKCNEAGTRCIIRDKYLNVGISDSSGNVIIPCKYYTAKFVDYSNIMVTTKDNKTGLFDSNGNVLLEAKYNAIRASQVSGKYNIEPDWSGRRGLADMKTGHIDIEPVYDLIRPMSNGFYLVDKNDKQGVINSDFKLIIPAEYYFVMLFPGNKYIRLQKETASSADVYGITDLNGKFVVPLECSWIDKLDSYKQPVVKNGKNYIFNTQTGSLTAK